MFRKFTLTMCFARFTVVSSTSRIVSLTCKVISPDLWLKEQGIYTHIAEQGNKHAQRSFRFLSGKT